MAEPYKVRASSWASLFDCAHKWEGQNLLGLKTPPGPRTALGSAIHASTAAFDTSRLNNEGLRPDDTADLLVSSLLESKCEVDWSSDDLSYKDAEKIGLTLHTMYCTDISPQYEFVSVEMETKPLSIDCGDDIVIQLTGTLDRCRAWRSIDGVGISDLKTGVQAVQKGVAKTKGHSPQIGTYELLYQHSTNVCPTAPGEIIGLKTSGKLEIASGQINNARQMMIGQPGQPGLIEFAKEFFRSGLFPPNPSSHLCSERYCARWNLCPYHD